MKNLVILGLLALTVFAFAGSASAQTARTITLTWTAPGDDANVGTANKYEFRYSLVDSATVKTWTTATVIPNTITPKIAGSAETFTFTLNMTDGQKIFIGMKSADEVPNWSVVSNIAFATAGDTTPPAAVNNLSVTIQ